MKIAIIGCGYVGSALASKLKNDGHEITVTTRSELKVPFLKTISNHVTILQGNDKKALKALLEQQDAVILSLAADSQEAYETTYLETAKAISQVIEDCQKVSQIIYTGSTSVYGDHQGATVDEKTAVTSIHSTGKILIQTEDVLLQLSSKKRNVCIFRLGEIYGPGRQIADRLRHLNGKTLPGTGKSITNLISLDDIVKAITFALNDHLNGIYNLCGDVHLTRKDFYDQLCAQEQLPAVLWDATKTSIHSGNKLVSNAKLKAAGFSFSNN